MVWKAREILYMRNSNYLFRYKDKFVYLLLLD